jgi:hypothetical protein
VAGGAGAGLGLHFGARCLCHRIQMYSHAKTPQSLALPTNAQSALRGKVALRQQGRMGGHATPQAQRGNVIPNLNRRSPPIRHAATLRGTFPLSAFRAGGKGNRWWCEVGARSTHLCMQMVSYRDHYFPPLSSRPLHELNCVSS